MQADSHCHTNINCPTDEMQMCWVNQCSWTYLKLLARMVFQQSYSPGKVAHLNSACTHTHTNKTTDFRTD